MEKGATSAHRVPVLGAFFYEIVDGLCSRTAYTGESDVQWRVGQVSCSNVHRRAHRGSGCWSRRRRQGSGLQPKGYQQVSQRLGGVARLFQLEASAQVAAWCSL